MCAGRVSPRLLLASLLLYLHCIHSSNALSYSYRNDVGTMPPPPDTFVPTISSPRTLITSTPLPTPSTPSLSSLSSSIHTVSGCLRPTTVNGTRDCNLTSVLTITGDDFINTTGSLEIAYQVNCSLPAGAVHSPNLITTPICPYYYPQDTSFDVRLFSGNTSSAPFPSAISFHGTAPYITALNSTCNVPPWNGCDPARNNYITVYGHNFLSAPAPPVSLYIWLDTFYIPCRTLHISFTRFICWLPAFTWNIQPPAPSTKYGVLAVVQNANWLREELQSNFVPAVVSFHSSVPDSSSTGVQPPPGQLPTVSRVSGCEDSFINTRNCPWPYNAPIRLRLIGTRFTAFLGSLSVWVHDQPCPIIEPVGREYVDCSWDTNEVDWAEVGTTPMTVSLNSSAGWVNVSSAVSLNNVFANPTIESVGGCPISTYEQPKTAGCDRARTLTIYGDAFARYLPATLTIAYSTTVDCSFPLINPLTIECPLQHAVLNGIVRNVYVPVQLHLGDRTSEPMPYVSFAPDGVVPVDSSSSTGRPASDSGGPSADELVGMKLALLSMMIISLIILVVALAVWVTGWWLAHRRSYVSQYGRAAVDSQQVLLQ